MLNKINFVVFEDNAGGLSLFVLDKNGTPVWGHSGYEYTPEDLPEIIQDVQELDSLDSLDSLDELESWDGNGMYDGARFTAWDEIDGGIQAAYDSLEGDEWTEIVADQNGQYPDKMGTAARKAFNCGEF